jgi:hypothetical protein
MQSEPQKRDHSRSAYSIPLLTLVDGVFGRDTCRQTIYGCSTTPRACQAA